MTDIKEKAWEKYPVHLVTRNGMPWTEYDANEEKRNFYIEIATEQKKIDIEKIDQFCEEHWEEYFKTRSDMKVFKGWLKKAMED